MVSSNSQWSFPNFPISILDAIENGGSFFGHCTIEGNRITDFSYDFKPGPHWIR